MTKGVRAREMGNKEDILLVTLTSWLLLQDCFLL